MSEQKNIVNVCRNVASMRRVWSALMPAEDGD